MYSCAYGTFVNGPVTLSCGTYHPYHSQSTNVLGLELIASVTSFQTFPFLQEDIGFELSLTWI